MTAQHPVRYSVQRAAGPRWKTVHVEESLPRAELVLREMVRVNPRGYFRLIRLDYSAERSTPGQMEFDWKLLELYDPKAGGFQGRSHGEASPSPSSPSPGRPVHRAEVRKPRGREPVWVPVRLYALAVVVGALLAAVVYVTLG